MNSHSGTSKSGAKHRCFVNCAWRHSGVPFFDNFSTSALQKVTRTCQFFSIFTCKCASRYSGVQFFDIPTSKSGPSPSLFLHFDFKLNVLLASAACNFSTSQLQKVVRECQCFSILTCKCASRYSGVQFFHIPTSKSGPRMSVF